MQILSELAAAPDEIAALLSQVPAGKRAWVPPSWDGIPGERFTALGARSETGRASTIPQGPSLKNAEKPPVYSRRCMCQRPRSVGGS